MKIIFEMDLKEEWKKVKNYPYKVSNYGQVKRNLTESNIFADKILKLRKDRCGYLRVNLCKNGRAKTFLIHRLVAETFLGLCPKGKEVNHIDGNKENPYVENLEYVTTSENIKHSYEIGLKSHKGEKHPRSKLTEKDVKEIRSLCNKKVRREFISKKFNVSKEQIRRIYNKESWSHVA